MLFGTGGQVFSVGFTSSSVASTTKKRTGTAGLAALYSLQSSIRNFCSSAQGLHQVAPYWITVTELGATGICWLVFSTMQSTGVWNFEGAGLGLLCGCRRTTPERSSPPC